jgi:hypothetical protein
MRSSLAVLLCLLLAAAPFAASAQPARPGGDGPGGDAPGWDGPDWDGAAAAVSPTRPWVVDRSGLTAVPLPSDGWCEDGTGVVRVRVDALDPGAYAPPRDRLQRFLSGVRFLVQQGCPEASVIEVQGYANGTRSFLGSLLRAEDWRLEGAELR